MQIDGESKIIFVHIPRTGGSWFSYAWNSAKGIGPCVLQGNKLVNRSNYMPQVFWLEEQNAKFDHIYKFEDVLSNNKIVQKDFPLFNRGYANKNHLRRGRKKTGNEYFDQKQIERIKHLYRDDINFLSEHYKDLK